MSNQLTTQTQSKNSIVQAHYQKKIREYTEPEKVKLTSLTINYLLRLLGVSENPETSLKLSYIALEDLISDNFNEYSYEEIRIAFKMAIKGDLGLKMFQRLDAVIFGRVMQAYEVHKREQIKTHLQATQKARLIEAQNANEPNPAQIEVIMQGAVNRIKENYFANGKITERSEHVYDYLDGKGKMNNSLEYKNKIFALAKVHAKHEAAEDVLLSPKQLDEELDKIRFGQSTRTQTIAKRMVLEEYFNSF